MPTLFRFLFFIAVIAGLIFAGMVALVTFVQPEKREMIEIVPPAKLQPRSP
ncbi:MAG: histidine kinase [Bosea sp. (in: a-proteobacteria)]|uniref:histidine kinase n=1 Tax=unclassified Bosea (in: a-proteobacteria) TaxID=2653178 RepID=UPI000961F6B1|nr:MULTISPECIES: histidine kinase [unclassified Bosea (in: a-proteobacteria)]MBN9443247.1 histidine kinase [Bosea sp. (in: a-proteobacteria)]MBN9455601.1 histidine kinase [Bosea sp. (in: a-proteobacteria)]OJV05182.1 MAG: histidine kinase [Bosea sp. 67-29]